jgi:23S rRNA pseudouridine1911/1915/1917 synthase
MNNIEFSVKSEYAGCRIDLYLQQQQHDYLYSRTFIDKLISNNNILINSKICQKKSYQIRENDVITVKIDEIIDNTIDYLDKEDICLKILYEDEYLAIIDKPSGMTVHPGAGTKKGTLVNALLFHFNNNLSNLDATNEYRYRPGIVHRLDKDTSGLIIVAKDNKTHFLLSKLFSNREITKTYNCICIGVPDESGCIITGISRHKTQRKKMAVNESGKKAITNFTLLKSFQYFSLLKIKIETGRTHQIRVHFAHINHPILGDNVYNTMNRTLSACPTNKQNALKFFFKNNLTRQILHASELNFVHPITKKKLHFVSEIPSDFYNIITFLDNYFN